MKKTLLALALLSGMSAFGAAADVLERAISSALEKQVKLATLNLKEMSGQQLTPDELNWRNKYLETIQRISFKRGETAYGLLRHAYQNNKMTPQQKADYEKYLDLVYKAEDQQKAHYEKYQEVPKG